MPTFYDCFCESAERWPGNIAVEFQRTDKVESYTFAELRRMTESIGRWLGEKQLQRGARVGILASNHPRWVAVFQGIIAAGGVAVPMDTAFHARQVAALLQDSGSSWLFCDARHLAVAAEGAISSGAGLVLLDGQSSQVETSLDRIFAAGPEDFVPVPSEDDDLAALLYTSGTTADPKGVMLSHGNVTGEMHAAFGWAHIGPNDAVLGVLPLFHVLALMTNFVLPLVKGTRVVYMETLNSTELLRALSESNITILSVVPQFFYLIHQRIFREIADRGVVAQFAIRTLMVLTSLIRRLGFNPGKLFFGRIHRVFGDRMRYLVTAGSRFDPQIARDFQSLGIDVLQAYGLTETTAAAFATPPGRIAIGSVGPPLAGVQAKILDPQVDEEAGHPVGEIAIRGAQVMKGYWNRPDATAAVLKDGWLYTGDLGYFDSAGNLFITGRRKEVIILSNGKNIYPEEVEAHYLKSPFIKEICVLAMEATPGDPASDCVYAVVVPDFDALKQRRIVNAKQVIRFDLEDLSIQLPSTKRIRNYEIWQEDLPRTTTRKIKRFEVERRVRANRAQISAGSEEAGLEISLSAEDAAWLEQPYVQRALATIRNLFRIKTSIRPDMNLELDLGFDSMQRVELLAVLEQELGGRVEESRQPEIYTFRQLVDSVYQAAGKEEVHSTETPGAGWHASLQKEPVDPEVLALARPGRTAEGLWYLLSRFVALVAHYGFHLRAAGMHRIPERGPLLICSNHQSVLDAVILTSLLPWRVFRDTFFVGTSEIFGDGFMRTLARWRRIVVVDPDANLIPAMRAGAFGLKHGRVLVLYPEGERSIDGTPKTFKKGAAILSIHLQVPIVPVAIEGFHDAWPRGKRFQRFAPLQIRFGDPIYPPPEAESSDAAFAKLTAELRARIVEMWEEARRH